MHAQAFGLFIVNLLNLALIGLLFFTAHVKRIPRHPVISTILWMAIPRSLVAGLPALTYHDLQQKLPWKLDPRKAAIQYQHTSLARFCAAQGILMYFFLAAQAFFAICFTVPMLMIAIQSSKLWRQDSRDSNGDKKQPKHVKLPSAYLLSASPFIWALPTVFLAIPVIIAGEKKGYPTIYYTPMGYCTLDSVIYQMISAILVGVPLIVGAVLAILVLAFIVRFYTAHKGVPRRGRSVDVGLLLRFTGILLIIYVDAILLLCEISLQDNQLFGVWHFDVYWTTLTPMAEFFLLGSQATFLQTWRAWLLAPFSKLRCRRRARSTTAAVDVEKDEGEATTFSCPDPITPVRSRPRSTILAPAMNVDEDFDDGASDTTPHFVHQDMEEEDELAWSSDDEFDRKHRARRQARNRARRLPVPSRLFQWERSVPWDGVHVGAAGPPSITVSRASGEHAEDEELGGDVAGLHDVPEEESEADIADAVPPPHHHYRPRLQLVTAPLAAAALPSSATMRSSSTAASAISASSTTPLRQPRAPQRDSSPSSPTFAYPVSPPASTSALSLTRTISLTDAYGRPMDYMYGEMHTFMGIGGLPRARAVEMHAAARIQPDGAPRAGRRPRRRGDPVRPAEDDGDSVNVDSRTGDCDDDVRRSGSVKASRRRSRTKMFSFDEAARPASLSTVDESLAALPPLRHEIELETLHEHD